MDNDTTRDVTLSLKVRTNLSNNSLLKLLGIEEVIGNDNGIVVKLVTIETSDGQIATWMPEEM